MQFCGLGCCVAFLIAGLFVWLIVVFCLFGCVCLLFARLLGLGFDLLGRGLGLCWVCVVVVSCGFASCSFLVFDLGLGCGDCLLFCL